MALVTRGLLGPLIITRGLGTTPTPTPTGTIFWSGPVAGTTGQPSTAFSVAQDSLSGPDTITPHTNSSGTFTPTSVLLGPASGAQTFTYTAAVDGTHIITITDSLGATIVGGPVNYIATSPPRSLAGPDPDQAIDLPSGPDAYRAIDLASGPDPNQAIAIN